jgi:hypothetical protein
MSFFYQYADNHFMGKIIRLIKADPAVKLTGNELEQLLILTKEEKPELLVALVDIEDGSIFNNVKGEAEVAIWAAYEKSQLFIDESRSVWVRAHAIV